MNKEIEELIEEYSDSPVAVIRAHLTIAGFNGKEVTEALKEAGISKAKVGFNSHFYDWLAEEERDQEEVNAYILGDGEFGETSENIQRHRRHYALLGNLASRIWAAK